MPAPEYSENRIEIGLLRHIVNTTMENGTLEKVAFFAAAALLECHDDTGIGLDDWEPVRALVEFCLGTEIEENGV